MMFDTMPVYLGYLILVALIVDISLHWPTPRKVLEYENKSLREEATLNNIYINDLQKNVKRMRDKELRRDKEMRDLEQIVTILAEAQGIKDWKKLLKK